MRKLLIVIILALTALVACGTNNENSSDVEGVNRLSATEVANKIEDSDTYIFVLGNDDCPACKMYKENLKDLVEEEEITLDYIDLLDEEKDNYEAVSALLVDNLNVDISSGIATPTTFIVKDGNVVDQIVGPISSEELMSEYGEHLKEMK